MSERGEKLGTALFVAMHVAAYTLLGTVVHDETAGPHAVAAAPDTPLEQPDPPPQGVA
ncbi:hypothetical protein AB0H51_28245 [Streptomyces griseoluteus]|uniref:hypothetical protein n=1 Tax=Streptomyces griseoluteus TaxID=29306 RepID=UPI0033DDEA74